MPIPGGYSYYVSPDEVRLILAGSENNSGTAAGLSDADINEAITEAQQEVDGRLSDKYTTPFTSPPAIVVSITKNIAAYLATLTYRRGNPIQTTEPIALLYTRAQNLLAQIVSGAFPLQSPTDGSDEAATGPAVSNPTDGDLWSENDFRLIQQPGFSSLTTPIFPPPFGW